MDHEVVRWIVVHGAGLLIGVVVLLLIYRVGVAAIRRIVPAVITAQATHLPSESGSAAEVDKRITTIEDLALKLLRLGVLLGLFILVLAVFELWGLLAAIGVVAAAVVLATKDVVLDYVMGFLILVEGPFFKGDYIVIEGHPGIEGTVEGIGLRQTVLRDALGSSHAVSNGLIRASSNRTRMFSVAVVEVKVLRAGDLDLALETIGLVVDEMRHDATWADRFEADSPANIWVTGIGTDGASIRLQQRVTTGTQIAVSSELRRRLAAALVARSIGTGRWDTPLPIVSRPPV